MPPGESLYFKGWYTDKNEASTEFNFDEPASEPRNAYAHWTTDFRVDLLDKGENPYTVTGYSLEVLDLQTNNPVTGSFSGTVNSENDQWISDRKDVYLGHKFQVTFSNLPDGTKVVPFGVLEDTGRNCSIKPVAGKENTFEVTMTRTPQFTRAPYNPVFQLQELPKPEPTPTPTPTLQPTPQPNAQYWITIDPNGGIWPDGTTKTLYFLVDAGDIFTLPAPLPAKAMSLSTGKDPGTTPVKTTLLQKTTTS